MTAYQIMCSPVLLIPAYGRTYPNTAAMQADWDKGLDFKMYGSGYCSIRDLDSISKHASSVTITDPRNKGVTIKVA